MHSNFSLIGWFEGSCLDRFISILHHVLNPNCHHYQSHPINRWFQRSLAHQRSHGESCLDELGSFPFCSKHIPWNFLRAIFSMGCHFFESSNTSSKILCNKVTSSSKNVIINQNFVWNKISYYLYIELEHFLIVKLN